MSAIELSHRLSGADIAPLKRYETTHIYIGDPKSVPDLRRGGPFYPEERRAAPPAVRPHVKRNPQKQSGHTGGT
jgi:hypothetical protein